MGDLVSKKVSSQCCAEMKYKLSLQAGLFDLRAVRCGAQQKKKNVSLKSSDTRVMQLKLRSIKDRILYA